MAGKQATNYPVYVVGGKDVHRKTQTLQKIRADLLGDDQGLGEIRFDGKTVDLPTVLDERRTPAFLARHAADPVQCGFDFNLNRHKRDTLSHADVSSYAGSAVVCVFV